MLLLAGPVAASDEIRFSREVLPILADRCFHCHGPDAANREADLRLDARESAIEDRGGYAVIQPGDAEASELIKRIVSEDPDVRMPPPDSHRKELSRHEVATLRQWIAEGARWGKHWSFEQPIRPANPLPDVHPIDGFVRRRLSAEGLQWSPAADKRTLIRRASLDLTGLPATPQEIEDFLADDSPNAWERVVDRLLDSPHYGERMAWPWLDAARYADTAGYQGDPDRTMWPWRDWVIDAFNQNMPFDRFTIEQLAGDLLPNATPEQRLATGFNRNHMYNSEGGRIPEETRVENVFDRVETTGTVWLGLTMQCARCHDHKFDPTSNRDYFAFYDFFNQTSEAGKNDRGQAVPPAMEYSSAHGKAKVMVMDTLKKRRQTFVLVKGLYNNPTDQAVTANVPGMLPPLAGRSDGRPFDRLDLAQWITAPENPLMARVTVNRLWQTFFGRGLVATPEDFGVQGEQPTHPDLLDWLASEFVRSGWNVKSLVRQIVQSQTYCQSAAATPEMLQRDPTNRLLARSPRYRLPSWMLRDQALSHGGLLVAKLGGPPVRPYQPDGIWAEATFGKKKYKPESGEKLYRRSIYTFWRRIVGPTMFFDASKRQTCEVKPNRTNTPLHALTTLNDITFVEASRFLAQRVMLAESDFEPRLNKAFVILVGREPNGAERRLLATSYQRYVEHFRERQAAAAQLVSVGEGKRDDSLDTTEHAAMTVLMSTLMNLDEVLVRP